MFQRETRFTYQINLNAKTLDFHVSDSRIVKKKARVICWADKERRVVAPLKYQRAMCIDFHKWLTDNNEKELLER